MTYIQANNKAISLVKNTELPIRTVVVQYPSGRCDVETLYNDEQLETRCRRQIVCVYLSQVLHDKFKGGLKLV